VDLKPGHEDNFLKFMDQIKEHDHYIKIVLEKNLNLPKLIDTIQKSGTNKMLYLQPEASLPVSKQQLSGIITQFSDSNLNIRVLPQIHKKLQIR